MNQRRYFIFTISHIERAAGSASAALSFPRLALPLLRLHGAELFMHNSEQRAHNFRFRSAVSVPFASAFYGCAIVKREKLSE